MEDEQQFFLRVSLLDIVIVGFFRCFVYHLALMHSYTADIIWMYASISFNPKPRVPHYAYHF